MVQLNEILNKTICGDAKTVLMTFPDEIINCCVTSPPYYGLRDYGVEGQIGLEETPEAYIQKLVEVFREVRRVLKDDGTLWLNLGDSYAAAKRNRTEKQVNGLTSTITGKKNQLAASKQPNTIVSGLKPKDLIGIPWMVAFALRADGWYLRQDIIWHKPNPMPESVTDRCTKSHEYIFLLSKQQKYYYDSEAIKEDSIEVNWQTRYVRDSEKSIPTDKINGIRKRSTFGNRNGELNGLHSGNEYFQLDKRNKRSVWTITTKPFSEAHFATFPPDLIVDCIKAGCPKDGIVLDPFGGSGTTRIVSEKLGCNSISIELNPEYIQIENKRRHKELGIFAR